MIFDILNGATKLATGTVKVAVGVVPAVLGDDDLLEDGQQEIADVIDG